MTDIPEPQMRCEVRVTAHGPHHGAVFRRFPEGWVRRLNNDAWDRNEPVPWKSLVLHGVEVVGHGTPAGS